MFVPELLLYCTDRLNIILPIIFTRIVTLVGNVNTAIDLMLFALYQCWVLIEADVWRKYLIL